MITEMSKMCAINWQMYKQKVIYLMEYSSNTCYTMNDLWKHGKWQKLVTKDQVYGREQEEWMGRW